MSQVYMSSRKKKNPIWGLYKEKNNFDKKKS